MAKSARHRDDYVLRLYVSGMTPRSTEAIATIKRVCDRYLNGRYDLEVVDVYQHPELAGEERIVVLPTLVRRLPVPLKRLVGDLASDDRVVRGLELMPASFPE